MIKSATERLQKPNKASLVQNVVNGPHDNSVPRVLLCLVVLQATTWVIKIQPFWLTHIPQAQVLHYLHRLVGVRSIVKHTSEPPEMAVRLELCHRFKVCVVMLTWSAPRYAVPLGADWWSLLLSTATCFMPPCCTINPTRSPSTGERSGRPS